MIKVGDTIPETLGADQNGNIIRAEDLRGQPFILYFYPKDHTSGCTAEACSMRDHMTEFKNLGIRVIGVSKDSPESHQKFIKAQRLPFDLIADTDHKLQQAFGVWVQKQMYGRQYYGTLRSTYIIDQHGIVRYAVNGRNIKTKEHAKQLLEVLKDLNLKDEE